MDQLQKRFQVSGFLFPPSWRWTFALSVNEVGHKLQAVNLKNVSLSSSVIFSEDTFHHFRFSCLDLDSFELFKLSASCKMRWRGGWRVFHEAAGLKLSQCFWLYVWVRAGGLPRPGCSWVMSRSDSQPISRQFLSTGAALRPFLRGRSLFSPPEHEIISSWVQPHVTWSHSSSLAAEYHLELLQNWDFLGLQWFCFYKQELRFRGKQCCQKLSVTAGTVCFITGYNIIWSTVQWGSSGSTHCLGLRTWRHTRLLMPVYWSLH